MISFAVKAFHASAHRAFARRASPENSLSLRNAYLFSSTFFCLLVLIVIYVERRFPSFVAGNGNFQRAAKSIFLAFLLEF